MRKRSLKLTNLFLSLFDSEIKAKFGSDIINILTPREENRRGSHLSVKINVAHAKPLFDHLYIKLHIVGDFRYPQVIRFSFTGLYNNEEEVKSCIDGILSYLNDNVKES